MVANEAHFRNSSRHKLVHADNQSPRPHQQMPELLRNSCIVAEMQPASRRRPHIDCCLATECVGCNTTGGDGRYVAEGKHIPLAVCPVACPVAFWLSRELIRVAYWRVDAYDAYRDDSQARSGSQRSSRVAEVIPGHSGQGWAET